MTIVEIERHVRDNVGRGIDLTQVFNVRKPPRGLQARIVKQPTVDLNRLFRLPQAVVRLSGANVGR